MSTEGDLQRIFCTITFSKTSDFEEDEYWRLKKQLEDLLEFIADPWLLYPSFSSNDFKNCLMMFETNANAVDIINNYMQNKKRFGDDYRITCSFD